ncbi:S41 family peptidase [Candidatus Kaiserbacteria bacterium]|nr:S41 family peptidase [Candidatus Kaiserbacteria bacterium]
MSVRYPERLLSVRFVMAATILVAVVGFGTGFLAGHSALVRGSSILSSEDSMPQDVDFAAVWKAWHIINDNFVPAAVATSTPIATTTADLNQQKVYGMIGGLAASLNDPYTFFLPPVQNTQFASDMSGAFEGVGMEIDVKDGVLTVVSPLKGTPAEKSGIRSSDIILKIDGVSTEGMDVSNAVKHIRGPKGSTVVLTVLRSGWDEPREIKIIRDVINVPVVTTTERDDGIFVIQVATFTANAPDLFRAGLREFVTSGKSKLILDLRGNPGGYLDGAVNIGSWFLPSGAVIVTEDYAGHAANVVHRSLGYNVFNKNLKMVVLVDKGSASASEILAEALRYHGVAKIVGTNTFGKGVVQELFPITDDTSLKVTVARWLGPDGIQIPHDGIVPDIMSTTTEEFIKAKKDVQMEKAVEVLNKM